MSTRNKLLESIVLALGGTVTNPNNRNQLLYDWLTAKGGVPPQTRYVYNFNGVDSYIALSQTISIADGGWLSAEFTYANASKVNQTIFGLSGSFFNFLHIISSTSIRLRVNGAIYDYVVSAIIEGSNNKIRVDFNAGQSPSLTLNGVNYQSSNNDATTGAFEFNVLAQKVSSEFFEGAIYNYQDSLGNNLPINDRTFGVGAPIANIAAVLGPELWVNPTLNGWLDNGGGSYTLNGDGTYQNLQINTVVAGNKYLIKFKVDSIDGPMKVQSSGQIYGFNSVGEYEPLLEATANLIGFSRSSGVVNCTLSGISIREANGYAEGVNLLESGWTEIPL